MIMTHLEFRAALAALSLSQVRAAKLFGVTARAARSWALGENKIPQSVAILLRLLTAGRIGLTDLE